MAGRVCEYPRSAGSGPQPDQSAQSPQIHDQDASEARGSQRRDEEFLHHVETIRDDSAEDDSDEQSRHHIAKQKSHRQGENGRDERPKAVMRPRKREPAGKPDSGDQNGDADRQSEPTNRSCGPSRICMFFQKMYL